MENGYLMENGYFHSCKLKEKRWENEIFKFGLSFHTIYNALSEVEFITWAVV